MIKIEQVYKTYDHRVVFMSEGSIVEEGPPESFFAAPKDERVRQFLSRVLY